MHRNKPIHLVKKCTGQPGLRVVHQFVPRSTAHRILNYVDAFIRVDYTPTTKTVYLRFSAN